jgi:hypothetical protein
VNTNFISMALEGLLIVLIQAITLAKMVNKKEYRV